MKIEQNRTEPVAAARSMEPTANSSVVDAGDFNADPIQIAIRKLIVSSEIEPVELLSPMGRDDNAVLCRDDGKEDHRLLVKLVSQVEAMKEDGIVSHHESLANKPDEVMIEGQTGNTNAGSSASAKEVDEILKELKKVRRQNTITHCLLTALIVLTAAWQLSEVSLLLKVKDGVSHPFRSLGSMFTKMIKRPGAQAQDSEKQDQTDASVVNLPKLPRLDLPSLGLNADKGE